MSRFSDAKYIQASIDRSAPGRPVSIEGADLTGLRGLADSKRREAQVMTPDNEGEYEPVSFAHPLNGRRIYGWLTAVDADGNARVEIGEGEYAVVPPDELRRLGQREDRSRIQADLKRAIGQVSWEEEGVRADMHETMSPMPLGLDGDNLQLLSLNYSTSFGHPSDFEILQYVNRFHPTASIMEVDSSMPGRVGVAVRLAEDKDAEFDAAHGGEVTETFDPADVKDEEGHEKDAQLLKQLFSKTPQISPADAARALTSMGQKDLIDKAMRVFFNNGGAQSFTKNPAATVNLDGMLAMAMPVVQRADPRLYKTIAQAAHQELATNAPVQPGQRQAPGAPGAPQPANGDMSGALSLAPSAPALGAPTTNPDGTPVESQVGKGVGEGMTGHDPFAGNTLPQKPGKPGAPSPGVAAPQAPGAPPSDPALQEALAQIQKSPETAKMAPAAQQQLAQQMIQQQKTGQMQMPGVQNAPQQQQMPGAQPVNQTPAAGAPKPPPSSSPAPTQNSPGALMPQQQLDPMAVAQQLQQGMKPGNIGPAGPNQVGPMTASRRANIFEKKAFGDSNPPSSGSGTIKGEPPPDDRRKLQRDTHLTSNGLPPSMTATFNAMKMDRFARRGDYVVARVEFDPEMMKGRTKKAIENTVISFVKAKCGGSGQGRDFGIMGKVYVLKIGEKSADVQFASEHQGPAPTQVTNE